MKRFFNVCAILLAICLAASFVSCKNDDDDDDDSSVVTADSSGAAGDPSVVAVYTYSEEIGTETYTFYDKTVTRVYVSNYGTTTVSGTWTGSLSGTGTITINGNTVNFSVSGDILTIVELNMRYTKLQ